MNFLEEQKRVGMGMFSAGIFSLLFVVIAYWLLNWIPKIGNSYIDHIVFAIHCDFFAMIALLLGIIVVATQRFFTPSAIEGLNPEENKNINVNVSYIQNTLEQFALLFVSHLTLSTLITTRQIKIIPILVALFLIGRICFWIGYHKNPTSRAFGFATTFYPTAIVFMFVFFKLI